MIVAIYRSSTPTLSVPRVYRGVERRTGRGKYTLLVGSLREGISFEVDEVTIQGVEVNTDFDIVIVDARTVEIKEGRAVVKV